MEYIGYGFSPYETTYKDMVRTVAGSLVSIVTPDPNGPIRKVYDHQPGFFEDFYPALSVEHTGFELMPGTDEVTLPNTLYYTVRVWVPVRDPAPGIDGYAAAQAAALDGFDSWLMALIADPNLKGQVLLASTPRGQTYAVQAAQDTLYAYEASVQVRASL